MNKLLVVIGVVVALAGLFWAAQGMGWIMWPQESAMLADRKWAWIGGSTALAGLALALYARRR